MSTPNLLAATTRDDALGVVLGDRTVTGVYMRFVSRTQQGLTKMYPAELGVLDDGQHPIVLADHVWDAKTGSEQLRGRKPDAQTGLTDLEDLQTGGPDLWRSLAYFVRELEPWRDLFGRWRDQYFRFVPHRIGTERRRDIRADPQLQSDGSNLPEALLHLWTNDPAAFEQVQAVLTDVVPDAGRITVPAEGESVSVTFVDPAIGLRQNIKDLGTGVEQLALAAYAGERTEPGSIVAIEEPESHLHAGAQRRLLEHLQRWARDRLIIASTHSTVFLDRSADARSHVWLVDRVDGEANLKPATPEMAEVLEAIGVRIGDLLLTPRLLVVEGVSDEAVLTTWFSELFRAMGVTVVASHVGGAGARWAATLDRWLQAPKPVAQRIRFLRDRDELDRDDVKALEDTGAVRVLPRRELENYLLNPERIHRYLKEVASRSTDESSVATIAAAMRQRADALKPAIIAKSAFGPLFSTRSVDRASVTAALGTDPPETADSAARLASQLLPDPDLLVDAVKERWHRVARQLEHVWDDQWDQLAPGEELLDAALGTVGRRYRKSRDAALIAAHHDPPRELETLLEELLA